MNTELITQVSAFLWQEADMLDHGEYAPWLESWTPDGLYIVPIDPLETDFANTLNYAYDDAAMREKRVARLCSGESISTSPVPRTIRSVSRFRILTNDGTNVTVRCAQNLREFRTVSTQMFMAAVTNAKQSAIYYPLVMTIGSLGAGLALWRGGLLPEPNGTLIFCLFAIIWTAVWFWKKYR